MRDRMLAAAGYVREGRTHLGTFCSRSCSFTVLRYPKVIFNFFPRITRKCKLLGKNVTPLKNYLQWVSHITYLNQCLHYQAYSQTAKNMLLHILMGVSGAFGDNCLMKNVMSHFEAMEEFFCVLGPMGLLNQCSGFKRAG